MISDHSRRSVLKSIDVGTAGLVGSASVVIARGPLSKGDTIVDIASDVDRFSILANAVEKAGLVGALSGKRQLTVAAPNN